MRKINILGLDLRDYTLREKMQMADRYLQHGALGTISCVSAKILMRAEGDAQQKQWLEAMDILEYHDADILRAAGITARNRLKEAENNSFIYELIKKAIREKHTLYLLSDDREDAAVLEEELERQQGMQQIAGRYIIEADTDMNADTVINDINDKAPDVILARLSYPMQEAFICENRKLINADIWVGLRKGYSVFRTEGKKTDRLFKKLQRKLFRRKVHRYENQEKTER